MTRITLPSRKHKNTIKDVRSYTKKIKQTLAYSTIAIIALVSSYSAQAAFTCKNQDGLDCSQNSGAISSGGNALSNNEITLKGEFTSTDVNLVYSAFNLSEDEKIENNSIILDGLTFATGRDASFAGVVNMHSPTETINNSIIIKNNSTITDGKSAFSGAEVVQSESKIILNSVQISDSTISETQEVFGGKLALQYTGSGHSAENNSVTIKNSTVSGIGGKEDFIAGAKVCASSVGENYVSISNSTINDIQIAGAVVTGEGAANYNSVSLSDSRFVSTWYDTAYIYGARSAGSVDHNSVLITKSEISLPDSVNSKVYGAYSENSDASNNSVTLNGVTAPKTDIYGAYAGGEAKNNVVRFVGNKSAVRYLYGGSDSASSGNRLEVNTFGNFARGIANFQSIEFHVPGTSTESMLTLTDDEAGDLRANADFPFKILASQCNVVYNKENLDFFIHCTQSMSEQ